MSRSLHAVLVSLCLAFAAAVADAHPPVGIVVDSRGNVFFTDLSRVWQRTPDGRVVIAVPDVHTHELALDRDGALYGEHLWYNGERLDTWGHYVWRRTAEGRISRVIGPSAGFLTDYGFPRDAAGNTYFSGVDDRTFIAKRAPNGRTTRIAQNLKRVRWLTVTPGGTVFAIDRGDLIRVDRTGVHVLAKFDRADHAVMGLWTDARGDVFVADYEDGSVKRISTGGLVTIVFRSRGKWRPSGGVFAPNGDLWVLEWSNDDTRARAVKVVPR